MSGWWTKYPLPEGWEVKYHWETKKFFYVDHINKATVWTDPRIELYKEVERMRAGITEDDEDESNDSSSTQMSQKVTRENKAKTIHGTFPGVPLTKILSLLESNYDNVFAVESKLNQEIEHAESERAETKKREAEAREKELAERKKETKRKQEEEKKRADEEDKRKIEESKRRIEEEKQKRIEEEKRKLAAEEKKRRAEELEKQKIEDEIKRRQEEDKGRKEQLSAKVEKINDVKGDSKANQLRNDNNSQSTSAIKSVKVQRPTKKSSNQMGPNKSFVAGADPQNVKGPNKDLRSHRVDSLARGADPLNRCGPQMRVTCSAPLSS